MTISEIRKLLESPYDQQNWKEFLRTHFTNGKLFGDAHTLQLVDKTISKECFTLGNYEVDDYTKIGIFEVQLNENVNIARNRVALRNLIKDLTNQVAGAMVVFVQGDKWRFSYVSKRKVKNSETNQIEDKETAPKRYTYLFGKGEKALTAAQRFDRLIQKQQGNLYQFLTLNDFEEAFSVEKLSKDFFKHYKDIYEDFVQFLTGKRYTKKGNKYIEQKVDEPNWQLTHYFNKDDKQARDFCKRMMGRIVFLYFIQKKGWLAVPQGKKWGEGNADYLFNLFQTTKHKDDFYYQELVALFFTALNNLDSENPAREKRFPYLNGGLFDSSQDSKFNKLQLPESIFKDLFDRFNEFNFTIYEDAPDEHTVAVDPEMLGHIFENLLEDNKDKGAFYTPKEIVHYMCRESLSNYIYGYAKKENDSIFKSKLQNYFDNYDIKQFSNDEIKQIDRALEDVKICDPAIGSGAFPMGLLHEIYNLKIPIEDNKGLKAKSPADLKKHIIEESIYGVDIDAGAVDISRLRFWLSLIVDEEVPQPLPNLNFKIVCADSLIPLGDITAFDMDTRASNARKELEELRHEFFNVSSQEKMNLERKFKKIQTELLNLRELATKENYDIYTKLYEFNPFDDNSCSWFDAWWMFGVKDGFDIVIGNPPYVDSEKMTKLDDNYRNTLKKIYSSAKGNWDLFIVFVEKAFLLGKQNAVISLIVPNKLISAKYSEDLRKQINNRQIIEISDYSNVEVFKTADVYPIILISNNKKGINSTEKVRTRLMSEINSIKTSNLIEPDVFYKDIYWDKYFFSADILVLINEITNNQKLKSIFSQVLGAATVSEAYEIKEIVQEYISQDDYLRLINTGTIDPYKSLWGIKNTQYIKSNYVKPIILNQDLGKISKVRLNQSLLPKIIIAGMALKIEAFYDEGQYCAGKSTSIILGNPASLKTLTAILNSNVITFWFSKYFNSLSMAGGYFNIGNNELGMIPLPDIRYPLIEINNIVDYLVFLYDENNSNVLDHTDNIRVASHIEDLLNMMVYELYFKEHMQSNNIDVLNFIKPIAIDVIKEEHEKAEIIKDFYLWYQKPENAVRQRMLLIETRSREKIAVINKSV